MAGGIVSGWDRWMNKWDFSLVPSHGNMKERKEKKDGTDIEIKRDMGR